LCMLKEMNATTCKQVGVTSLMCDYNRMCTCMYIFRRAPRFSHYIMSLIVLWFIVRWLWLRQSWCSCWNFHSWGQSHCENIIF